MHALDGFGECDAIELIVPRSHRDVQTPATLRSTGRRLGLGDTVTIDGFRCLTAERMILEAPLFRFTRMETENAIDSAIRLRRVSEQRLRTRAIEQHRRSINGGRALIDALIDTGGESRLERWTLRLIGDAGLPRPQLRKVFRDGTRVVARVDMLFGDLVVEVAGHGTHATRRQRQHDEQRRTELTLRGYRVITFTYEDIRDRPQWVIARLREALQASSAPRRCRQMMHLVQHQPTA